MKNNKSFVQKPTAVERHWYLIDAEEVVLGRLTTKIAGTVNG